MDAVEEVKSRITIDDLVGRYVDLKRSGASLKGLCPFHQEKTPSFYVTPARGSYHCFGCGKGGDIFSFLMEVERLAFADALKQLAEQAGVTLPDRGSTAPSLKKQLHEVNELAATFFRRSLEAPMGTRSLHYLETRGFDRQAAETFQLGFAPEGRDHLVRELRGQGIEPRIMLAAGLVLQDDAGTMRDRFRGRLMFPIRDSAGRISGFGGRTLGDDQPKYLNSPQTEIFDKSAVLYGVHLAADAIRQAGRAVLVEGYLDAVRAHRAGFAWTVASLGTAVTVPQLIALSRLTSTVVLALDPDPAGQAAAARTSLNALAEVTRARGRAQGESGTLDLRVARLPADIGDPDDLIREHPERWEQIIDASVPAFDFYFAQTMGSLDRSSDGWKQDAIDRLLPLIQVFAESTGWQALWIQRLARETGIDVSALQRTLPAQSGRRQRQTSAFAGARSHSVVADTTTRGLVTDPALAIEEGLLALTLKLVVIPQTAIARLRDVELQRQEYRVLIQHVLEWSATENYDYELFRETIPEDIRTLADKLRERDIPLPDDEKVDVALEFHLARLQRVRLGNQLTRISQSFPDVDAEGRAEAEASVSRLTAEQQQLDALLNELSKMVLRSATGSA